MSTYIACPQSTINSSIPPASNQSTYLDRQPAGCIMHVTFGYSRSFLPSCPSQWSWGVDRAVKTSALECLFPGYGSRLVFQLFPRRNGRRKGLGKKTARCPTIYIEAAATGWGSMGIVGSGESRGDVATVARRLFRP